MPSISPARTLLVAAVLLAGCSSRSEGDAVPAAESTPSEAVATSGATPAPLDLCALMPMSDVSALLQANGVDPVNTIEPGAGGMCAYRNALQPRGYTTKLLIDFTRFASVDKAKEQMQAMREEYATRHLEMQPVAGIGDEAMTSATEGASSVRIRVGAVTGQINLRMGEREPSTLQPAVLALGRKVVERLPK